ncbi:MAG: polynucleotide adenylyltransferase PcnB [Pseudomonadota bacterium]
MSQSPTELPFREIPFEQHGIARKHISSGALKVTDALQKAGFKAYVVGGGPRDLLLNAKPKDFDVGTDATPEQVRDVLPRARLIGRRFRLAHVRFGREIIEIATFRGTGEGSDDGDRTIGGAGRVLRDNVFGSEAEDAIRRDFTINALMYDPTTQTLRDYTDGYNDIRNGRLRLIGDPETRYREDPVRMLRALRFMTKLSLKLEAASEKPIRKLAPLLVNIPPSRLLDELLKIFLGGCAWKAFEQMVEFGLWQPLFPGLLEQPGQPPRLIEQALKNTDQRVREQKPVTPGFLFAALFWPAVQRYLEEEPSNQPPVDQLASAGEHTFLRYTKRVAVHRRYSSMAREIWMLQPRFERRRGKRALRLLGEKRFRAAYDFLLLRGLEEAELAESIEWWTRLQAVDETERREMIFGTARRDGPAGRKQRPRKKRSKPTSSLTETPPKAEV